MLKLVNEVLEEGGSNKQSILKVDICLCTLPLSLTVNSRRTLHKMVCTQVSAFLRDIDAGADEYNEAWDEWADKQNLPVSRSASHLYSANGFVL